MVEHISQSSCLFRICPHGDMFSSWQSSVRFINLCINLCRHIGCLALGCYTVLKGFCPVVVYAEQCQKRSAFSFYSAKKWTVMYLFKQAGQWSSKLNAAISILNLMIWMYMRPFSQALDTQLWAYYLNIKH